MIDDDPRESRNVYFDEHHGCTDGAQRIKLRRQGFEADHDRRHRWIASRENIEVLHAMLGLLNVIERKGKRRFSKSVNEPPDALNGRRVRHKWNHSPDGHRPSVGETLSDRARPIVQILDHGLNASSRLGGHRRRIVDDTRNGRS